MHWLQYEKNFAEYINISLNSIIDYFSRFKEGALSGNIFSINYNLAGSFLVKF
jgi:hypothetical protein